MEGAGGVVGPAVAHMDGMGNSGAADDDGCTIGMGIGYVPLAVSILNAEAGEGLVGKEGLAARGHGETDADAVALDGISFIDGCAARRLNLAVSAVEGKGGKATANLLLVLGMDVGGFAYVDDAGHADVGQALGAGLCLADGSPAGLGLQVEVLQVVGNLHEVERHVGAAEELTPIADECLEERLVLP